MVDLAVIADNAFQRAPPNLTFDGWVQCLQWLRDLICLMLPKEPQHWYHGMSFCGFFNFSWAKGAFNQFRPITIGDNELQAYDCAKNAHQLSKWITHIIRLSLPDWKPSNARPSNCLFQNWMMCVAFKWNPSFREKLTSWMNNIRKMKGSLFSVP